MTLIFIKREDGAAFIPPASQADPNVHKTEEVGPLNPDDLVDGKKVSDWAVGMFHVEEVVRVLVVIASEPTQEG